MTDRTTTPDDEGVLSRTFRWVWEEPRRFLFWRWIGQRRLELIVRAERIGQLLANQAAIDGLYKEKKDVTGATLAAIASQNARALGLPEHEALRVWDAYCELNHFPKAVAPPAPGAEISPSSTSAFDSRDGHTTSDEQKSAT